MHQQRGVVRGGGGLCLCQFICPNWMPRANYTLYILFTLNKISFHRISKFGEVYKCKVETLRSSSTSRSTLFRLNHINKIGPMFAPSCSEISHKVYVTKLHYWIWMVITSCEWMWMVIISCEWMWMVIISCEWMWMVIISCEWMWMVIISCERMWMVITSCEWMWMVIISCEWMTMTMTKLTKFYSQHIYNTKL